MLHVDAIGLIIVCRLVYPEKVISTLVKRADVNAMSLEGLVPLDLTESPVTIRLLLAHGATPNYQQAEKCLPYNLLIDPIDMAINMFIIGNQGVGKSTLAKVISVEAKGLARLRAYFFQVKGVDRNTAGIIPLDLCSKIFGKVTIYDFAGHREYYAGHGAVLHNSLAGSPSIILLVVDMRDTDERFRENLQYWLEFVNIHSSDTSKTHLVIVGSHADQCKRHNEKIELIKTTAKSLNLSGLTLKGTITLDCRFAESASIRKLRSLLSSSCQSLRNPEQIAFTDHYFLVLLLDKFKGCPAVTISMVEEKLLEISKKEVHWSFMKFHSLLEICQQLNKRGNILFMKNVESPKDSWIIIDKAVLLSQVNGVMFAPKDAKQHRNLDNSTGLVSQTTLTSLFPNLDSSLITKFLCHLEFCQEITDPELVSSLRGESIPLPNDKFFLFPGLINCDAPHAALQPSTHHHYHAGWVLQCTIPEQFFTPRFIQVLLLWLAFKFAFTSRSKHHALAPLARDNPALRVNCKIWRNGISWLDRSDARAIVEVKNHKQVVFLVHSVEKIDLIRLRSSIIRIVLKAKEEFCHKLLVDELLVLPEDAKSYPLELADVTTVTLTEVAHAVKEGKPHAIINTDKLVNLKDLLHFEPYADLGEAIIHELFCEDAPEYLKEIEESFLHQMAANSFNHLHDFTTILNPSPLRLGSVDRRLSPAMQLLQVLQLWMEKQRKQVQRSRWSLGTLFDQYSIFAGRSPLAVAMSMFTIRFL